jgi:protein-disulfide isomerase
MAISSWRATDYRPIDDPRLQKVVEWRAHSEVGFPRIGPVAAPVTVTVFTDYTCPNCGAAMRAMRGILIDHPDDVAMVIRHFPLANGIPRHAAIVAECGDRMGRFEATHNALVALADSLEAENWASVAEIAGLDPADLANCMRDTTVMSAIARDLRDGFELGVTGTPSFLVNDRFFRGNPPASFLRRLIEASLGEQPMPARSAR